MERAAKLGPPHEAQQAGEGLRMQLARYAPVWVYLARRIGIYVFTVWGAITLAFWVFRLMPGDPMTTLMGQLRVRYEQMNPDPEEVERTIKAYKAMLGLDQPLHIQYVRFLRNMFLRGFDTGPSLLAFPKSARDLILQRLPWTIGYFTSSVLIAWVLGTLMGTLLGWLRRHRLATVAVALASLLTSTPSYLLGIVAIIVIAYQLKWLPPGMPYAPGMTLSWDPEVIKSILRHAILPVSSMVLVIGASFTLGMRMLMISVLGEDYLAHAKAKGLKPQTILRDYAFRNALLPQVTALGISLGFSLNGAVIIEAIFLLPGLGGLFVQAMGTRDFNLMQGIILLSIMAVLTLGLLVDLILPWLDPRIRRTSV
jgi:peptide/nickel transport system permease protein